MSSSSRLVLPSAATLLLALFGAGLQANPGVPSHGTGARPAGAESTGRPATPVHHSPQSICLSPDGSEAFVVNATANTVSVLSLAERKVVREFPVGLRPYHAAFSPDGKTLYVSSVWDGRIDAVDPTSGRILRSLPAGLEPNGFVVSRDGRRLYVANAISDDLSIIDLDSGTLRASVPVKSQPRFALETPDGARVIVSNNLGRAFSIIDPVRGTVVEHRDLDRCSLLRQMACSSDGRWLFLANLVSHDEVPTLQIERGWIHSNGITIADLTRPGHRVTLLLDHLIRGAANPTGLVLSSDNRRLYVSLAGIHEVAIVDVEACLRLVATARTADDVRRLQEDVEIVARLGIAKRVPAGGTGPRSLVLDETRGELLVANYFSDSVSVLDAESGEVKEVIPLGPPQPMSLWREGEMLSCDARICYQNWYSCVSCHQEDATVDGLNWDLANDGLGNPKNAKDLLNGHDTAPAMWGAVRADLNDGVAGGQRFLGFVSDAERQKALMTYFGNPEHAPNPYRGRDTAAEERGRRLFVATGCSICHPAPLYTDLKVHDMNMGKVDDFRSRFDTPSLRGVYRTGPWLHDGRAPTLHSLFRDHNPQDVHGRTKGLSSQELDDLIAYVRTL